MAKMVRSAMGQLVDWDLLRVQTAETKNVAVPVEIVNRAEQVARRERRARLDAARTLLAQAEIQQPVAAPAAPAATTKPTIAESATEAADDNGWDDLPTDEDSDA